MALRGRYQLAVAASARVQPGMAASWLPGQNQNSVPVVTGRRRLLQLAPLVVLTQARACRWLQLQLVLGASCLQDLLSSSVSDIVLPRFGMLQHAYFSCQLDCADSLITLALLYLRIESPDSTRTAGSGDNGT